MDHVVYLDSKPRELEQLLNGTKRAIIRGASGRKLPYGRVFAGDTLYFIVNNGEGLVRARAQVEKVLNSPELSQEESIRLVDENQPKLLLNDAQHARWAGKRFLVLIEVTKVQLIEPFQIDRIGYSPMDDWLPVGEIALVRITRRPVAAVPRLHAVE